MTRSGRAEAASLPSSDLASDATDSGTPTIARPSPSGSPLSPAFTRLKWTSFFHSCVYTSLLICAFALGKPQPETLVLGWAHGLLWIGMSLACIAAARMRIVSLRLAVAVAVLGGIGPFFGSAEFVREQRRRATVKQT
ncbi:MAG TPA: hypothetical protein VK730_04340 [Solirubrobacteraceae bacterium]|nr:hypothetical protein [Solirubrobacteraceae bacterium]